MTEFAPKNIESPVVGRVKSFEVLRNTTFLQANDLQFETRDWPNGKGLPVRNAQIIHTIGSVASDLIVTISPDSLSLDGGNLFTRVDFTPHLGKLSDRQREIVYGLIASCCDPQKMPLDRPVEGLSYSFSEEFRNFIFELYAKRNKTYQSVVDMRDDLASRLRDYQSPFE